MRPKVVLRLQLLDMRQGPEVAELLRLPTDSLVPERSGATLRRFSPGGTSHHRASNRVELVGQVSGAETVRAEFEFDTFSRQLGPGIEAVAARGSYQLAPTNTSWPELTVGMTDREDERLRASLLSLQQSVRWNEMPTYPTFVEWEVTLRGAGAREPWAVLVDALTSAFSSPWTPNSMTAYGDLLEKDVFNESVLGRLAPWPRAYPQLAGAFEDLYPVLLGPLELCSALKKVLSCDLRKITAAAGETIGLLHIPDGILNDKESHSRAAGAVIERSEAAKKRPPDIHAGEHQIGRRVLFTRRRLRELMDKGAVAPPPDGFAFAPIIDETHWRALGLTEDVVLMELWQVPVLDQFRREIATAAELSREPDAKAQTWAAYSQAFGKWFRTNEVLDYIRRLTEASTKSHG